MPRSDSDDFGALLSSRLYPNTDLHPKQLCHALGWHPVNGLQSIYNHMGGKRRPDFDAMRDYCRFFIAGGDYEFMARAFPGTEPLVQYARIGRRAVEQARAEDRALRASEGTQRGGRE